MGRRVVCTIAILLVPAFLVAAETDSHLIRLKTVGQRHMGELLFRDLLPSDDHVEAGLSDEDALGVALVRAFLSVDDMARLKKRVDGISDGAARRRIMFDILRSARVRGMLAGFAATFVDVDGGVKDDTIMLLLGMYENAPGRRPVVAPHLAAFQSALLLRERGDSSGALAAIDAHRARFPRLYFLLLIEKGGYQEAHDFISAAGTEESPLLAAFARYCMANYGAVVDLLHDRDLNYEKRLLLLDSALKSGGGEDVGRLVSMPSVQPFERDAFWIFRTFTGSRPPADESLIAAFNLFASRWRLRNQAAALAAYSEEIAGFSAQLERIRKELEQIDDFYGKLDERSSSSAAGRALKSQMLDLDGIRAGIGAKAAAPRVDGTQLVVYFDNLVKKSLDQLEIAYEAYRARREQENRRLAAELSFRLFERRIKEWRSDDGAALVAELERLRKLGEDLNLSYREAAAYDAVYLRWRRYTDASGESEQDAALQEVVAEVERYLSGYRDRERDVLLVYGEALEGLGAADDAFEAYQRYFALAPDADGRVLMKAGEILFDRKEYTAAMTYFARAGERSETYRNAALYKIGWCHYLLGAYDEVATRFLSYDFGSFTGKTEMLLEEIMDLLSRAFFKMNDDEKVSAYLRRYPLFPHPDKLYKYMGDIHLFLADYNKALDIYEKGLSRYYLYAASHELLSAKIEVFGMMGREADANAERMRFARLFGNASAYGEKFRVLPSSYRDTVLAGGIYFNAQYDRTRDVRPLETALDLYGIFLEYFPRDAKNGEVAFLAGQLHEDRGNFSKAAALFIDARNGGFRVEESLYRSLYCRYRLWQTGKMPAPELVGALKAYADAYPRSDRSLSVYLVTADISLKVGGEDDLFDSLGKAADLPGDAGLRKALEFAESSFGAIGDKRRLAALFDRGWESLKDRHYLDMKHYALFTMAQSVETAGDTTAAGVLYRTIIDDSGVSNFREFAVFNLGLLLQKEGKVREALDVMESVREKEELRGKAKKFIYVFGKKEGMFASAARAAEELAAEVPAERMLYLTEAAWLFLRAKEAVSAGRVVNVMLSGELAAADATDVAVLDALLSFEKGDMQEAYERLAAVMRRPVREDWRSVADACFHEAVKKAVITRPDEEARNALEGYVVHLGDRYRATSDPSYLYDMGEIVADFSVFFLQRDEALSRARDVLRKALFAAAGRSAGAVVVKSAAKLKELMPDVYGREFRIPLPSIVREERMINEKILD